MFKTLITYSISIILLSCNRQPEPVNEALGRAGTNKAELQKVIDHYKNSGDKEKLKAAYFLIENMPNKYGIYYPDDNCYLKILSKVDSFRKTQPCLEKIENYIAEVIKTNPDSSNERRLNQYFDLNIITADYLIENIDLAFKVWREKPWAKHLNFDEFCEWILPYRVNNEPLQGWRKFMNQELSWLDDSMKNSDDPKEAALLVNRYISERFFFSAKFDKIPLLGGIDGWHNMAGICEHRYLLVTMAMRSVGIPVTIDFTFQFPRFPGNHSWTVLLDKDKKIKPFNGGEKIIKFVVPAVCPIDVHVPVTTVFRNHYAKNPEALCFLTDDKIPSNFINPNLINVTELYVGLEKGNIKVEINDSKLSHYAYLYSFGNGFNVEPIAYAKIKGEKAIFENIGKGGIYFVGIYDDGKLNIDKTPFIWGNDSNNISYINTDILSGEAVTLYRKYPVKYTMLPFIEGMKGAKLQGANKVDFSDAETLYQVNESIDCMKEIAISSKNVYRFFRYLSSENSDIRIAEVQLFYNNTIGNKIKIKGKTFGYFSNLVSCDDGVFENAFDDNIRTNFNAPKGSWCAIDAGSKIKISSIKLMPRNHFNIVEKDDKYELFYFDKNWHSLGQQVAIDNFVTFKNVPKGTLLLLHDVTKGQEERIFIYENNQQVWW